MTKCGDPDEECWGGFFEEEQGFDPIDDREFAPWDVDEEDL